MWRVACWSMVVVLCGCGESGGGISPNADAATAPDAGSLVAPPVPPAPPAAVSPPSWDCPAGWSAVDMGGSTACEPWPGGSHERCESGQAHFPGTAGCAELGTPCSATSMFAVGLPESDAVLFVAADAAPDGDGTRDRPFASIADAMAVAAPNAVVALSKGTFEEKVSVANNVTLWGACPAETHVYSAETEGRQGAVVVETTGGSIRNLTIRGEAIGLVTLGDGAVEGVVIEDSTPVGWFLGEGAQVTGAEVVVRRTRSAPDGRYGRGIHLEEASLEGARFEITENVEVGVVAFGPAASIAFSDVVISRTASHTRDGVLGGALAAYSAQVTLERFASESNHHDGLFVSGEGSHLVMEQGVVRDTMQPRTAGPYGSGAFVSGGGHLEMRRVRLERNTTAHVLARDPGTEASLVDVWAVDGRARPDGAGGFGAQVADGAHLNMERVSVGRSQRAGLVVASQGRIVASDVTVRDTVPAPDESDGRGLSVETDGHLRVHRLEIANVFEFGVAVQAGSAELTDVVIGDVSVEASSGDFGRALSVTRGATLRLERARLERSREVGVFVSGADSVGEIVDAQIVGHLPQGTEPDERAFAIGAAVTNGGELALTRATLRELGLMGVVARGLGSRARLQDVVVADMQGHPWDRTLGHGVQAERGGGVSGQAVMVERARGGGVVAIGTGSSIEMEGVQIRGTDRRACRADEPCTDELGNGVVAAAAGRIRLGRFIIADNVLCGGQVAADGSLDLTQGVIARQPIGLNVQIAGYDINALTQSVVFVDNEQNVQSTNLAVPSSSDLDFSAEP